MSSLQQITVQEQREINSAFYSGYFLTLFTGPVIGAIPFCVADPQRLRYKAYYLRGMSFGVFSLSIVWIIITIIVAQSCSSQSYYYSSFGSGGSYYTRYSYDCSGLYGQLIPVAVVWFILGAVLLVNSRRRLAELQSNQGIGDGPPVIYAQPVYYGSQPQPQQPVMQWAPQPQYGYAPTPVAGPCIQPVAVLQYPEPALPPYSMDSKCQVAAQAYSEPPGPPPAHSGSAQRFPQTLPSQLTSQLSLESLALHLAIPKLLNVTEGVSGVMELPFNDMREKYQITEEEYLKIKAYRKNLGK